MSKIDQPDGLSDSFNKIADDVPQILWSVDADGTHDYVNRQLRDFVGDRINTIGSDNWMSLIHPDDRERVEEVSKAVFQTTDPYEIEYRLLHHSGEYRWLRLKAAPKLDENGHVVRWYGTSTDIHLEKLISVERELVTQELDHRIRNLFALVNGLINLSVRDSPEMMPLAEALKNRLAALHRAHGLIRSGSIASDADCELISIQTLIGILLKPYETASRFAIVGDDAFMDRGLVTLMTLIIHELATNSTKYGALSVPDGVLQVRVSCIADVVRIDWEENGAKPSNKPATAGGGFGSKLLDLTIKSQLRGSYARNLTDSGMRLEVVLPRKLFRPTPLAAG